MYATILNEKNTNDKHWKKENIGTDIYLAEGPWQRRHEPWGPQESPSLPAASGTVKNNIVQL